MSVMSIDPKIFQYVRSHIEKEAYKSAVYLVYVYFRDKDIEEESLRLVKKWADMNYNSYALRYAHTLTDEDNGLAPSFFIRKDAIYPTSDIQTLKYLEAIRYNIEPEHWQLDEEEKQDLETLDNFITGYMKRIICNIPEYGEAKWGTI